MLRLTGRGPQAGRRRRKTRQVLQPPAAPGALRFILLLANEDILLAGPVAVFSYWPTFENVILLVSVPVVISY